MCTRISYHPLAVWLIIAALPVSATAQVSGRAAGARIQRPTAEAASQRIGGTNTMGGVNSLEAPRRDVALLGESQFEFTRTARNRRGNTRNAVLPVGYMGLNSVLAPPGGSPLSAQLDRTGDVLNLSGLRLVQSLELPLPGYATGGLPAANAYLFTPRSTQTDHEAFFGLQPVRDPAPPDSEPGDSYAAALEAKTRWRVAVAERDGLAAFKAGTKEGRDLSTGRHLNCPNCEAELVRANQKLQIVRSLDKDNSLVLLLLAHIAMDRDRPTLAAVYTTEAFDRNPGLFAESPDSLDQYFGDVGPDGRSPLLRAQVRRYVRIGELNPENVEALIVEMYCAWRMGDAPRIRDAYQRFSSLAAKLPTLRSDVANLVEAIYATAP